MFVDPFSLLLLFSATIILGYAGYIIFEQTGIPDVIWLLLLGILIGPVLHIIQIEMLVSVLPFLSSLALIIILFDAGITMNFYQALSSFTRSMLLSFLNVISAIAVVAAASVLVFGFDIMSGVLLGSIIAGTSSAIVIAIASRLSIRERLKTTANLESIFTDPFTVVVPITIIGMITSSTPISPVNSVFSAFSVGAVLGMLIGVMWLTILHGLSGRPFDYMLSLAMLFILYVFTEAVGGSGAISSLVFGIVLGNGKTFSKIFRFKKEFHVNHLFKSFQKEVSFFIRSFFFVYLGIIVSLTTDFLVVGISMAALVVGLRFLAVYAGTAGTDFTRNEKNLLASMASRGLATAVVSTIPAAMGLPNARLYSEIGFIVILATTVYTAFASRLFTRRIRADTEKNDNKNNNKIKDIK